MCAFVTKDAGIQTLSGGLEAVSSGDTHLTNVQYETSGMYFE